MVLILVNGFVQALDGLAGILVDILPTTARQSCEFPNCVDAEWCWWLY